MVCPGEALQRRKEARDWRALCAAVLISSGSVALKIGIREQKIVYLRNMLQSRFGLEKTPVPWLERLFRLAEPHDPQAPSADDSTYRRDPNTIAPEKLGIEGEYDENGMAKRVALALDEDPNINDLETVYLAQKEGVVLFKGKVPDQETLDELVNVARRVEGVAEVETDQVAIGSSILTADHEALKDD